MPRIIEILETILEYIKEDNPFGLVLKGGTALALHHLPKHRESEDLDFDVPIAFREDYNKVVKYIEDILSRVKKEGVVEEITVRKKGFASTDRYHFNILIRTHLTYQSKIDLDFVELPEDIEKDGELGFYSNEYMLVSKIETFAARREIKDLYDIYHLLRKVRVKRIEKPNEVANIIDEIFESFEEDEMVKSYKNTLRNIDLRFRDLKEANLDPFVKKVSRNLKRFRNELRK